MKTLLVLVVAFIAVIHVHLSMFTVENPLNPSFWIILSLSAGSNCEMLEKIILDILILGLHCIVTTFFAWLILKWAENKRWLLAYFICIIFYLILWKYIKFPFDITISRMYDSFYMYGGAFKRCVVFSILQIIYLVSYRIMRSHGDRGTL